MPFISSSVYVHHLYLYKCTCSCDSQSFLIMPRLVSSNVIGFVSYRAVIWLQKQRDEILERMRGGSLRKEEQYEYHIGRLRQDRVHISRANEVSTYALASIVQHFNYQTIVNSVLRSTITCTIHSTNQSNHSFYLFLAVFL